MLLNELMNNFGGNYFRLLVGNNRVGMEEIQIIPMAILRPTKKSVIGMIWMLIFTTGPSHCGLFRCAFFFLNEILLVIVNQIRSYV